MPIDLAMIAIGLRLYLRALSGIYSFGKEDLRLRLFYEDRMRGLHQLGSISLSFSVVSFTLGVIALARCPLHDLCSHCKRAYKHGTSM